MTTHFLYLFDPLCGWCYGASTGIAAMAEHPGVTVETLPTGLFAGDGVRALGSEMRDHILASDRRIAASTGAVFGDPYHDRIVRGASLTLDSGPATLALTAVAQTAPHRELDALRVIQRARYVDGRDIADVFVLIDLLVEAGLDAAAVTLANPAPGLRTANEQRLARARSV
ncbi:DsbA family protein, partial [Sphingomonas sp. CFBP 13728]|uniref:DsbA family protein n=1 Tax=Sphingomonas sp. CFBP 13728 TaxID=2775294 RepID=UPI0017870143|nr:DsbA family protein [Sphingomonas sp. CFBP 13728]